MSTVLLLVPCAFSQQAAIPSATDSHAFKAEKEKFKVHQLSHDLEKLIKIVEDSTLPCETRNSVVRRLRKLDDALRSGNRSAAQAMVQAWRQHAWNQQAARVIGPELGSSLQRELGAMEDQIGYGWPDEPVPTRNWKPLPSCESRTGHVESASGDIVGSYDPALEDPSNATKILLKMSLSLAPRVGGFLGGLVDLLWPAGSTEDDNPWKEYVDLETYNLVSARLQGLMDLMSNPDETGWNDQVVRWKGRCDNPPPATPDICVTEANGQLLENFGIIKGHFVTEEATFQQSGHELALLPLYAQYENLYMSFLRDGMILHDQYWSKVSGADPDDLAGMSMAYILQPDACPPGSTLTECSGIGYVNRIYIDNLPKGDWATRNTYIRHKILNVLDYRDIWKYLDPRAYPKGVPGGVKLTRMIYSDMVGYTEAVPNLPSNVAGPLKEVSVWTKWITGWFGGHLVVGSVQATNPPLLGPAQSGVITGDTAQTPNHAHYYNLSALGPIIQVNASEDLALCGATSIDFVWAAGGDSSAGDSCSNQYDQVFNYDGEVLATAQVINPFKWDNKAGNIADAFVFGFRFADSFSPAGEVIGVNSGKCIRLAKFDNGTQAEIYTCNKPAASDQIWTYDPVLQQISVTNPAEWSETDPTNSGKHCLDAPDGSAVIISACDDGALTYDTNGNPVKSSQRWTIDAEGAGIGKITNVKSGRVVTASSALNGGVLTLATYTNSATQQWKAHWPLTGELHGIGSGRCVDVPDYSTTPGTQVQIYDCHGNAAQQWTYDPTSKELIYAYAMALGAPQPMCLEARGGGTTSGTAVQINTCAGALEQQWTLEPISFSINQGGGGTIRNDKSGLVMDVKGGNTGNGTLVQLYTSKGSENQQWSRTSSQGGALHAIVAGKCLGLQGWVSNSSKAVIGSCTSPMSAPQTWTYHPITQTYTVNSPSGPMCLDAYGGGTTAGTAVVINDCTPGAASQRWSHDFGSSTITNVNSVRYAADGTVLSSMVLDVPGGTADGSEVQLTELKFDNDGIPIPTPSQKWVWTLD